MFFHWIFGSIVIIAMYLLITTNQSEPDIYWRPYYGVIPDEAIRHPQEKEYVVARALLVPNLFPGAISAEKPYLDRIENNKPHDFLEILGSKHPEKFKWLPTTSKIVPNVTGKFRGGYSFNSFDPIYINYGSGSIYGVSSKHNFQDPFVVTTTGEIVWRDNYDLLTYES